MLPDRVSNPGPLTSQVPYRLRYAARLLLVTRVCMRYLLARGGGGIDR